MSKQGVSEQGEWPECDNHIEIQHRDNRPPWCRSCGWHRGRPNRQTPAVHVKDVKREAGVAAWRS